MDSHISWTRFNLLFVKCPHVYLKPSECPIPVLCLDHESVSLPETVLSASEIQRQVELYRECLQRELDSDEECVGKYYFLDFDGMIKSDM